MPVTLPLRATFLLAAAALLHSPGALAADPKGAWIKADKACTFLAWNPRPEPNEDIRWTGPCDDNDRAHGTGTLQWYLNDKPTSQETGQAVHGKWHGRVVSQINEQIRYEGEFAHGRRIGLTRQFYSRPVWEVLKTRSPHQEWAADGHWENDEFVLPMLHSRFQEPRPCPKAEQDRDLCVSRLHDLLVAENAALTTINQLGRCLTHAEMLMEVYIESRPDKKQVIRYSKAYEKMAELAKKKGYADHMEAAQTDSGPAIEADIQRLVGPRLAALRQKNLDEDAEQRAYGPLAVEALAPYFQKHCTAYLK